MRAPRSSSAALVLATVAVVLTGCAGTPSVPPSASDGATASSAPSVAAPSSTASGAAPSGTDSSALPKPAPSSRAATPAPSVAGDLSADSLPREILGFRAEERPPAENEFVPNGTWVHAVDARQAATQALPLCSGNTGWQGAGPESALMGSYADPDGRPGNALALSFRSPDDAAAYADAYREVLRSCGSTGPSSAQQLQVGDDYYTGRRQVGGQQWTELLAVRGNHVVLAIVQDDGHSTPAEAAAAAAVLAPA